MTPRYKMLYWDLDGTLLDTAPGVLCSLRYALREMGLPAGDEATLRSFIGPPLVKTFGETFGLPEDQVKKAVGLFRKRHEQGAALIAEEFPGMAALLCDLQSAGVDMAVVTYKPQRYADMLLKHMGYDRFFSHYRGIGMGKVEYTKGELLCRCIRAWDKQSIPGAMIGDRAIDVRAARDAGQSAVAVTWGFGSPPEWECLPVACCATNVQELREWLLP